jgi:hypothetical protein
MHPRIPNLAGKGLLESYFNKLTSRLSYRDDSFDGLTRVFPIHDACFSILTRALTGSIDSHFLNKDILYEVMECLVSSNSALDIDYGGIVGPDQFWVSVRGEEVSGAVTDKSLYTYEY